MTEFSYPFNAVETSPSVFDRVYDAGDMARALSIFRNGASSGLDLSIGTGLTTVLAAGQAYINGYAYYNDASKTLTHAAADATNGRYDLVVARLDLSNRTITAAIVTGTPAATPAVPALTNTATIVEIPLHRVLVRAAATSFVATDLTPFKRATERSTYLNPMDLNLCTQSGYYTGTGITNGPAGITTAMVWVNQYGTWNATSNILSCAQILMDYSTGKLYSRVRSSGGTWTAWNRVQQEPDTGKPYLYASKSGVSLVSGGNNISAFTFNTNIGPFTDLGAANIQVPTAGLYNIEAHVQISGVATSNKRVRFGYLHQSTGGATLSTQYIGGLSTIANDYLTAGGARTWAFAAGERIVPYVENGTGAAATLDTYVLTVTRVEDRS